mgnify:CR=1 FL=1|tara:strand:+ start:4521 stop:5270 length:750 start_codon:yes stop_codon:yes gene_type:complete
MDFFLIFEVSLIIIFILFQSIFGIGLLVFGTPTYLLLGHSFAESLSVLVPVSITISFYQIFFSKENISDFKFDFFKFCIPSLIIFLFVALLFFKNDNIKILMSLIMIFLATLNIFNKEKINNYFKKIFKNYKKLFFILIGAIHGTTNLGGGFLSLLATHIFFGNKNKIRKCIAYGYFIMGIFQCVVLILSNNFIFKNILIYYVILTFFLYSLGKKIFERLNLKIFNKTLYFAIFFYGNIILTITLLNFQ